VGIGWISVLMPRARATASCRVRMRNRSCSRAARGTVRPFSSTTELVGRRCQSVRSRKLRKQIRRACSAWRTCQPSIPPGRSGSSQKRRTWSANGSLGFNEDACEDAGSVKH